MVGLTEIASATQAIDSTKRNIIGLVGRFYDPLGILSSVVVRFKMFFQEFCKAQLDWDQPLTDSLLGRRNSLKSSLGKGTAYFPSQLLLRQNLRRGHLLHPGGFCDV